MNVISTFILCKNIWKQRKETQKITDLAIVEAGFYYLFVLLFIESYKEPIERKYDYQIDV